MLNSKFSGETMIFKSDKGFYSTSLSTKQADGSYKNKYINVGFKKGVNIPNKTKINIKNGWLTFDFYTNKEGKEESVFKIFVSEYEAAGVQNNSEVISSKTVTTDDDLPF